MPRDLGSKVKKLAILRTLLYSRMTGMLMRMPNMDLSITILHVKLVWRNFMIRLVKNKLAASNAIVLVKPLN